MSEKGSEILRRVHDVPARKIEIIAHGIPGFPLSRIASCQSEIGFQPKKTVILTFGLLSPSKGIETVIDAMPAIVESCPNAIYVILGATHPNLVREKGEAYRESLTARVEALGIKDHVVFFDQFVDQATLLDFISMCDVYVTPYLNEAQMTSGTLAYSFGSERPSSRHPTGMPRNFWATVWAFSFLLAMPKRWVARSPVCWRTISATMPCAMRAYAASRSMTWPQSAERYISAFETAGSQARPRIPLAVDPISTWNTASPVPEMRIGHFLSLCDSTGMLQHAVHCVPDRAHGYCIDDNARALLFACALSKSGETRLPGRIASQFAAFIQHAWNPDNRRFRNFMSYDRRWLEDSGSEDSHGRTLWALAECARVDTDKSRREWAAELFETALPAVEEFSSPRAWAFSLLGLDAFCKLAGGNGSAERLRGLLADRLMSMFAAKQAKDWVWFEDVLAYDNARLPQALIQTGVATHMLPYVKVGLRSLRWLMSLQTTPSGIFRPVGTTSFGRIRQPPQAFDQQPVEASATISACLAAYRADGGAEWPAAVMRAFGWFLGENDLRTSLIDADTGSCLDGLHPDRPNANMGAESTLSYLLGLAEVRQFKRARMVNGTKPVSNVVQSTVPHPISSPTKPGSHLVPIPIRRSPGLISAPGSGQSGRQTLQTGDRAPGPQSYR